MLFISFTVNKCFEPFCITDITFFYLLDELLGDLFYDYDEKQLHKELMDLPKFISGRSDDPMYPPIYNKSFLIQFVQFVNKKSPWRGNCQEKILKLEKINADLLKPVLKKTPRMVPRPRKIFSQTSEQVLTAGRKTRKYK